MKRIIISPINWTINTGVIVKNTDLWAYSFRCIHTYLVWKIRPFYLVLQTKVWRCSWPKYIMIMPRFSVAIRILKYETHFLIEKLYQYNYTKLLIFWSKNSLLHVKTPRPVMCQNDHPRSCNNFNGSSYVLLLLLLLLLIISVK